MSDQEMTTIVLNALPEEWGNFIANIWGKKEASSLNDLCAICKVEETKLKAKEDSAVGSKKQAFAARFKRKGKFGKFERSGHLRHPKKDMSKIQRFECHEYGHYQRDCPKRKKNGKKKHETTHVAQEILDNEKKLKEEPQDLYYD